MRYSSDPNKASPGCLRIVYSRDADGDPRYHIYDDKGCRLAQGYTSFIFRDARIERCARRALNRELKRMERNHQPEEVVYNHEKYNAYLEEKHLTTGAGSV